MNRDEIMKLLPHRNSMLLLDEAERIGDTAHGMYKVNGKVPDVGADQYEVKKGDEIEWYYVCDEEDY